jgi:hypothetical protein
MPTLLAAHHPAAGVMVVLLRKLSSRVGAKADRRDWGGQFVCRVRVKHSGASASVKQQ